MCPCLQPGPPARAVGEGRLRGRIPSFPVTVALLAPPAERDLRKLRRLPDLGRLRVAIRALERGDEGLDVAALEGRRPWRRLREGDWRIIFRPLSPAEARRLGFGRRGNPHRPNRQPARPRARHPNPVAGAKEAPKKTTATWSGRNLALGRCGGERTLSETVPAPVCAVQRGCRAGRIA